MDHGLTMSIYYLDPDGNGVELQVDNFGSCPARARSDLSRRARVPV